MTCDRFLRNQVRRSRSDIRNPSLNIVHVAACRAEENLSRQVPCVMRLFTPTLPCHDDVAFIVTRCGRRSPKKPRPPSKDDRGSPRAIYVVLRFEYLSQVEDSYPISGGGRLELCDTYPVCDRPNARTRCRRVPKPNQRRCRVEPEWLAGEPNPSRSR